jgi:pimeloyl-ACP methyl ester carboxylesterase
LGKQYGYQSVQYVLNPGDSVILVSDGIIEAFNKNGEMFGFKRLEQTIASLPNGTVRAMLDHLVREVMVFTDDTAIHDDVTIAIMRINISIRLVNAGFTRSLFGPRYLSRKSMPARKFGHNCQEVYEYMKTSGFYPFRSESAKAEYLAHSTERARFWPVASETKLIQTPSGQTFVRVSGDPADPPLILLPGSRATSLVWIPNIAALSAHYRTYALDSIYDVGLSTARRKLEKPEDLVDWLTEVLAALVPEGALRLAGISYGGWLAGQFALRFPQRLQKLVLISPAATVLPVSISFLFRAATLLLPRPLIIKKFLYWLLHDTVQSGENGRAMVDEAVTDWIVAQRCFGPLPLIAATVIPDQAFQALQVPTLFLIGEHEKVYSAHKAVRRLNRVAPQVKAEIILGPGTTFGWYRQSRSIENSWISWASPK